MGAAPKDGTIIEARSLDWGTGPGVTVYKSYWRNRWWNAEVDGEELDHLFEWRPGQALQWPEGTRFKVRNGIVLPDLGPCFHCAADTVAIEGDTVVCNACHKAVEGNHFLRPAHVSPQQFAILLWMASERIAEDARRDECA